MPRKKKWTREDIPDQTGKTVIVTGANSGTGFEVTKELAGKGAHIILACRNTEKGEAAVSKIREKHPNASLRVMKLDLADLSSVKSFVKTFTSEYKQLHILCNNAGVMQTPYLKTKDGFELQLGTNHLGHFALTGLLSDILLQTEGSRVVTMSSNAYIFGRIDFDNLNWEKPKSYGSTAAYGRSKLANLLFTYELQRKFEQKGARVISVASHPGYSATNLQSSGLKLGRSMSARLMRLIYSILNKVVAQSVEMGALPMLMAATSAEINGGDYIGPERVFSFRGYPKKVNSNGRSHNLETAEKLWRVSESLTGVNFNL
ncbi:MAG: oxidoreductase [Candidatus Hodarchaeota archaeon]